MSAIVSPVVGVSSVFSGEGVVVALAPGAGVQYAARRDRPTPVIRGGVAFDPMSELSLYEPQVWPELLSPGEVAAMLRLAQTTVARWCEQGSIEAVRAGRVWRIPREAVWPMVPPSIRAGWPDGPWKEHGASE